MKKTLEKGDASVLYSILTESKIFGVLTRYSKHVNRHGERIRPANRVDSMYREFLVSNRIHSLAFQGGIVQYMVGEGSALGKGKRRIILSDEIDNGEKVK